VEFTVFGPLEATRDGVAVAVGGPRQRAVLAALLLAAGRHVSTDALVDAVWGDDAPATAVKTIQKYVSQLRAQLAAPDLIVSRADGYSLPTDTVDVRRFEALLAETAAAADPARIVELATAALRLYRGEPYADLPDLPAAQAERRRLMELRMSAVEALAEARLGLGGDPALIGWLHEQLSAEPLRERLWAALMSALYRAGRQAEALAEYQRLRTILVEQLGTEPSPAVRSLHERILRQEDDAPSPAVGDGRARPGLPTPLTSFVGRIEELTVLASALADNRLVTLTGPAGSGKTRLAIEFLTRSFGEAVFVELTGLTGPDRIATTIAVALRVGEQPGRDARQLLADSLADRTLLLVLDNCEHLLDGTAELVADLLRATERLRVLATSRQPLGAEGEVILDLPPLAVPATDDPADVAASDAVQLLTQRARAADAGFGVTAANAAAVARIARRLDGMPLALELAAGRLRVFDPYRLADLLDDRFRVLVSTVRTAPARHQTLRAAISWSYDQLPPAEQELFRALAVFEGRFTLEAAERVYDAGSVIALLPALVDRSLVVVDRRADGTGYRLLESLREYGRAQLVPDEAHALHRRHLDHYLSVARDAGAGVRGPRHVESMQRLDADRDDLTAALRWALSHGDRTAGVRLVVALAPYWDERGLFSEGTARLGEAVADASGVVPGERARAFLALGLMAIGRGDHKEAEDLARQAMDLARLVGAEADAARATAMIGVVALYQGNYAEALGHLRQSLTALERVGTGHDRGEVLARTGHLHRLRGDYADARSYLERALALREEIGDASGAAWARWQLGVLARYEGDHARAEELYERSMAEFDAVGYVSGVAHVRYSMADLVRLRGEHDLAERLYGQSLAHLRELGDRRCTASVLFNLGTLGLDRGDPAAAEAYYGESLTMRMDLNDQSGIAECLEGFAAVDEGRGRPTDAIRLLAVADGLRTRTGSARPESDERAHAARIAELRDAVGADAFDAQWHAGADLAPDALMRQRPRWSSAT
jgi:predicted ATPase/DNA-binding SARP family transcriptional activator